MSQPKCLPRRDGEDLCICTTLFDAELKTIKADFARLGLTPLDVGVHDDRRDHKTNASLSLTAP